MSLPLLKLRTPTSPQWVDVALSDFDAFLIDHAACERKASATGMMFVVRYPDKVNLVEAMVHLAREELMHFEMVWKVLQKRGRLLGADEKDPYINQFLKCERQHQKLSLLDRLLIFGIVEARGEERFGLLGQLHPDPEFKEFYSGLAEAEGRHHELFVKLATEYFGFDLTQARLNQLLDDEDRILKNLPYRAAVH